MIRRPLAGSTAALTIALSLGLVPSHLLAQAATADTAGPARPAAPETAAPETAAPAAEPEVDTIVVTARRRDEVLQDVPVAVSVLGGLRLDETGSFNVARLTQLSPSLTFYSSNPRNSAANIRGLGAPFGLTNDGIEQGVGFYVDDVYYARAASSTFDFLDVQQIEILRGPQGTLYGKNTTAGAVNITTRAPSFEFEGRAEVTVGSLGFQQAKASVSGPLSQTLAARVAVSTTSRQGTIYNVTTRNQINELDNLGIRAQLLFKPSDTFELTLAADYNRQNPECCGTVFVRTGATQRPLNRQYAALAAAQNYTVVSTNPFDRLTDIDASINAGNEIGGVSLRIVWDVGPGTLTAVTAWRYWDWLPENDRDFTGLPIITNSQNPSQHSQYTQELRYNASSGSIDYVAGLFAFYQKIDTQGVERHGPASSRWNIAPANALSNDPSVLNGLTAFNRQSLSNTSVALFGQVSWRASERLTAQIGLRLNYDEKSGLFDRTVVDGTGAPVLLGQTGARRAAQLAIFAPQFYEPSFDDVNVSYDLTASYRFTPDVLGYVTLARTFKSGGINQNGVPTDAAGLPALGAQTIRPEELDHYEAGLKTQFGGRRVTLNLALFRTDIADYQAVVTNGQLGVLRGYLANAGGVRTQGLEADLSWQPSQQWNLYLNGAWTDATYTRFTDAPCPPELSGGTTVTGTQVPGPPGTPGALSPANCDISGQRLPGVSEWTFSYGFEYNRPARFLAQEGEAYVGFDGVYRSDFSSNPSPSAYTWIDGYALANIRIGFRTGDGFDVFAWVRNAFDEDYFELLNVPGGNTGLITGQPGDPRIWGVTVKAAF